MGKVTTTSPELAVNLDEATTNKVGTFRTNGDTFSGPFNICLDFTTGAATGSATLQRSFDGGATWRNVTDAQGNVATWNSDLNTSWFENENGILYAWSITLSAGSLYSRISQ